ncbi:MAG: T9SS type A sorting domain-containing protein [Saprospiraceae bacterium]|nr:T9SS type A sorting domain-containing protein [Saprospiraceae bacterium]
MKKCLLLLGVLLPLRFLTAQNDPPPLVAFGQYGNDFYQWSFTVGDLAIWTFGASQNIWTQGSQQPVITVVDTQEPDAAGFEAVLYPNPTADRLFLRIKSELPSPRITYELRDAAGRLIKQESVADQAPTEIDVLTLPAGYFLLHLTDAQGRSVTKTFIKKTN